MRIPRALVRRLAYAELSLACLRITPLDSVLAGFLRSRVGDFCGACIVSIAPSPRKGAAHGVPDFLSSDKD